RGLFGLRLLAGGGNRRNRLLGRLGLARGRGRRGGASLAPGLTLGQRLAANRQLERVPDRADLDGHHADQGKHQNREETQAHDRPHLRPDSLLRLETLRSSSSSGNSTAGAGCTAATGAGALAAMTWRLLA